MNPIYLKLQQLKKANNDLLPNPEFPYWESSLRENLEKMPASEFSLYFDSPADMHDQLSEKGFFLPPKKYFKAEWCRLWTLGIKEFLPVKEVVNCTPK